MNKGEITKNIIDLNKMIDNDKKVSPVDAILRNIDREIEELKELVIRVKNSTK